MTAPHYLHRPTPLTLALTLAFAAPASALAQQAPTLPAVTVSASALSLGSDEMSTPVTVLEGDELVRAREATLGETLAGQPDMEHAAGRKAGDRQALAAGECFHVLSPSGSMSAARRRSLVRR